MPGKEPFSAEGLESSLSVEATPHHCQNAGAIWRDSRPKETQAASFPISHNCARASLVGSSYCNICLMGLSCYDTLLSIEGLKQ